MGNDWSPAVLLINVIMQTPIMLPALIRNSTEVGKYHLGSLYFLDDFLQMDQVDIFPVEQIYKNDSIASYLLVSNWAFINFEVVELGKSIVRLVFWSSLENLKNIRKKDEQICTISWNDKVQDYRVSTQPKKAKNGFFKMFSKSKKQIKESPEQIFKGDSIPQLIKKIVEKMKGSGRKVNKSQPRIKLEDVTMKAFEEYDLNEILENIAILESELDAEITVDIVNVLMNMYQKAIEYLSALGDPSFEDFVDRMHYLLSRDDVNFVLANKTQMKKKFGSIEEEEKEGGKMQGSSPLKEESKELGRSDFLKDKFKDFLGDENYEDSKENEKEERKENSDIVIDEDLLGNGNGNEEENEKEENSIDKQEVKIEKANKDPENEIPIQTLQQKHEEHEKIISELLAETLNTIESNESKLIEASNKISDENILEEVVNEELNDKTQLEANIENVEESIDKN